MAKLCNNVLLLCSAVAIDPFVVKFGVAVCSFMPASLSGQEVTTSVQ